MTSTPVGYYGALDVAVCDFHFLVRGEGNRRPGINFTVKIGIDPYLVEAVGLGDEFVI